MGNSGNNRGICFGAVVGNAACGILWVGISDTLLVCTFQCWGDSPGCDGAEVGESLGWKISESLSDSVCASYLLMPLTGHGNCVSCGISPLMSGAMLVNSTGHCLMVLCQMHVMMSLSLGLSVGSSHIQI